MLGGKLRNQPHWSAGQEPLSAQEVRQAQPVPCRSAEKEGPASLCLPVGLHFTKLGSESSFCAFPQHLDRCQ